MTSYTAQIWNKETLLSQIKGLSLDAAREVCRAAPMTGHAGRVWCEDHDYTEVYDHRGVRRGPYAETTIVVKSAAYCLAKAKELEKHPADGLGEVFTTDEFDQSIRQ